MKINEKTYFKGIEITITTDPYELYGKIYQDGIAESGKVYTVISTDQKKCDTETIKKEWKGQQSQFRNLA